MCGKTEGSFKLAHRSAGSYTESFWRLKELMYQVVAVYICKYVGLPQKQPLHSHCLHGMTLEGIKPPGSNFFQFNSQTGYIASVVPCFPQAAEISSVGKHLNGCFFFFFLSNFATGTNAISQYHLSWQTRNPKFSVICLLLHARFSQTRLILCTYCVHLMMMLFGVNYYLSIYILHTINQKIKKRACMLMFQQ